MVSQERRLRYQQVLSQELLAAGLSRVAWDISRGTLAKTEARIRRVSDQKILLLAKALKVPLDQLYPRTRSSAS